MASDARCNKPLASRLGQCAMSTSAFRQWTAETHCVCPLLNNDAIAESNNEDTLLRFSATSLAFAVSMAVIAPQA